ALCDRYLIDNSKRSLHGALLDAEILSDVYLAMTGGQTTLSFSMDSESSNSQSEQEILRVSRPTNGITVLYASDEEIEAHEARLDIVDKKGGKPCLWRQSIDEEENRH